MVTTSIDEQLASELGVQQRQVRAAVELLDGGATVPFVARYRKEATGALDDAQLRTLHERPFEALEVGTLIRQWVNALSPGAPPLRRLDPRVTAVLSGILASDDLRISLAAAAERVFLSPSRFAHLFKQQMGLPFSRYMLWRKLTRAMLLIGSEGTIAAAAHAADFADAAHLTRTFSEMVGMAPKALMRGELAQIPSPFTTDAPEAPVRFSASE